MRYLFIDVGNNWVKGSLQNDDKIIEKFKFLKGETDNIKNKITELEFQKGLFTSTANIRDELTSLFIKKQIHELSHKFNFPFEIGYKTPETLGRDRIASIAGAHNLYPNQNCLIIDAGTCITYDTIHQNGYYEGGNIAPGLEMRSKSMEMFTDKLPNVNVHEWDGQKIGQTTTKALQNGVVLGVIYEIEGYIKTLKAKFDQFSTILTGGDAHFLHNKINSRIFIHPDLVFQGLYQILKYNAK